MSSCLSPEGRVVKVKREYISLGNQENNRKLREITYYRENGYPQLIISYGYDYHDCVNDTALYKSKYIFKYNQKGNLVDRSYFKDSEKLPWSSNQYSYNYDQSGNLIEKTTIKKKSFDQHKTLHIDKRWEFFKYNRDRKCTQEIIFLNYGGEDTTKWISNYDYDKRGNKIRERFVTERDTTEYLYSYDTIKRVTRYNFDGSHVCAFDVDGWEKKYDEQQNLTKKTVYYAEGDSTIYLYTYEGNKLTKEVKISQPNSRKEIQVFTYNSIDSLERLETYGNRGNLLEVRRFEYEYY